MKIVINKCFGGFGLSDLAYEKMIQLGIPVRKYIEEKLDKNGLFKNVKENDGEVIFDKRLSLGEGNFNDEEHIKFMGRYWETWLRENRTHHLLIKVVEELGDKANGNHAELKVVEIPDDVQYEINDYDGMESIHEVHRSW